MTKDVKYNEITNDQNKYICTFKLKDNCHKVEMKLRTYEQCGDDLVCTLIPLNKPKTATLIEIPIKALSLHRRIDVSDSENITNILGEDDLSLNLLTIKGDFSTSEINQILSLVIPDIPERTNKESIVYYLESTFLKTKIELKIENKICEIRTLFLSPLIIIKVRYLNKII